MLIPSSKEMESISRINTNLQLFCSNTSPKIIEHLYVDENTRSSSKHISVVNYNKCIHLVGHGDHISFQWCNGYSILSLYTMKESSAGKTILIHLPEGLLNQHFTSTYYQAGSNNELLCFDMILKSGIFISVSIPIDYILHKKRKLNPSGQWVKVLNPYDFSVRPPQLLCQVDNSFSVVFLRDGGLLGLKKFDSDVLNDYELQPILFNDSSYLKSITRLFSRNDTNSASVISALVFDEKYLVTLTADCTLKFWDLEDYRMVNHIDVKDGNKIVNYDSLGNYMAIYENNLIVYVPTGNGIFKILDLYYDHVGRINVSFKESSIAVNLSSFSIWSLVDMALTKPSFVDNAYLQLVLLWKSNTVTKTQVFNFTNVNLESYTSLETNNTYISDITGDSILQTNGNMEKAILNLKSHYSQATYDDAQDILKENNVILNVKDPNNQEYLTTLESILKELHKRFQDPSSLSILNGELVVVNNLQLYHHSTYKMDSKLETIFFNIKDNRSIDQPLAQFFKVLNGFSSTISIETKDRLCSRFFDIVNGNIDRSLTLKEKFTIIFRECLQHQFQPSNLHVLLEELNSIDVISIINQFLDAELNSSLSSRIDLLTHDTFNTVLVIESVKQILIILKQFVTDILLIFTIVEIDYKLFAKQLNTLLELNFNVSLWLQLYQIDNRFLTSETFRATSQYGYGVKIISYQDLTGYTNEIVKHIRSSDLNVSPLLIDAFDNLVLNVKESDKLRYFHQFVMKPFHMNNEALNDFLYALSLYKFGDFDQSLEVFTKHDYTNGLKLPNTALYVQNEEWSKLFSSISSKNKVLYYYELSRLYSQASSYTNALKTIKKSIALDTYSKEQLLQYLDTLLVFSDFKEILDVMRIERDILGKDLRKEYYEKLLTDKNYAVQFTKTLFSLNFQTDINEKSISLSPEDFMMIDSILSSQVEHKSWTSIKKLYVFRILNHHERRACETLFAYVSQAVDDNMKRKSLLMILNVLKTFDDSKDQWFISSQGHIVHLFEIQERLCIDI